LIPSSLEWAKQQVRAEHGASRAGPERWTPDNPQIEVTMTRCRTAVTALSLLALGGAATLAPSVGVAKSKPKPVVKIVSVHDDYYSVAKLRIKRGAKVKFTWSRQNFDSHNVTLISGPKGVKLGKFRSATGATGVRFERQFTVPGHYHFECTIHPMMNLSLTVTK
jgi:plastocyanin